MLGRFVIANSSLRRGCTSSASASLDRPPVPSQIVHPFRRKPSTSATAKRRPDTAPANRGSFSVTGSSRDVSPGEGAVLANREGLVVMSVNVIPEGLTIEGAPVYLSVRAVVIGPETEF